MFHLGMRMTKQTRRLARWSNCKQYYTQTSKRLQCHHNTGWI